VQSVVRDTTTWLQIFLELNADGSNVLSGTGDKYTCSGMFRSVRPRESHSMTSWCLGRSIHCPVLSVKGRRSLYCPETRWREVEDSQQSRRVTTCRTGKAVSDADFDGADDGESTTILQASGRGNLLRFGRSPAIPATDRRRWSGTAPAFNRLSESISLLFCSL